MADDDQTATDRIATDQTVTDQTVTEQTGAGSARTESAATGPAAEPGAEPGGVDPAEPVGDEPLGGGAGAAEPVDDDHVTDDSTGADPASAPGGADPADESPEDAADGAEGDPEADLVQAGSGFPDLTEDADLDSALEALLLVVDAPAEDELLAVATDQPVRRVREALRRIAARYTEAGSGIDLRRVSEGWRLFTRDRFAPVVEKLLLDGQRAKLTRAALETLAVIAYRQPVTRSRVAAVRGVNVDGVIRTLVVRGLIEETGTDPETGGILYRTTELFLERLGLSSLEDLPPIAPLLPEVDAIDDVN